MVFYCTKSITIAPAALLLIFVTITNLYIPTILCFVLSNSVYSYIVVSARELVVQGGCDAKIYINCVYPKLFWDKNSSGAQVSWCVSAASRHFGSSCEFNKAW